MTEDSGAFVAKEVIKKVKEPKKDAAEQVELLKLSIGWSFFLKADILSENRMKAYIQIVRN